MHAIRSNEAESNAFEKIMPPVEKSRTHLVQVVAQISCFQVRPAVEAA